MMTSWMKNQAQALIQEVGNSIDICPYNLILIGQNVFKYLIWWSIRQYIFFFTLSLFFPDDSELDAGYDDDEYFEDEIANPALAKPKKKYKTKKPKSQPQADQDGKTNETTEDAKQVSENKGEEPAAGQNTENTENNASNEVTDNNAVVTDEHKDNNDTGAVEENDSSKSVNAEDKDFNSSNDQPPVDSEKIASSEEAAPM